MSSFVFALDISSCCFKIFSNCSFVRFSYSFKICNLISSSFLSFSSLLIALLSSALKIAISFVKSINCALFVFEKSLCSFILFLAIDISELNFVNSSFFSSLPVLNLSGVSVVTTLNANKSLKSISEILLKTSS